MRKMGKRLNIIIALLLVLFTAFVMTNCGSGGGSSGGSINASDNVQVPNPPDDVKALAGDEEVTLSWSDVSDAQSYNIYWTTDPAVIPDKPEKATSPHVHTGLTNGTTYYYAVTAVNSGGESNISSVVSATPQAPLPGVPSNVSITAGIRQVTISWDPVAGADSYNVYWKTASGVSKTDTQIAGVLSPPYVHTGISNGTSYYYVVTAVNSTGEGGLSSEVSAMPTFGNVVLKKLLASDGESSDFFGYSVAIDGDYAIVGAYLEDEGGADAGAAYIFHRADDGSWDSGTKIMAPIPGALDYLGISVAINGDYAIVGAYGDKETGFNNAGAAYIFHRTGVNTWDDVTKIIAPDPEVNGWFGRSVAISGDYAVIGAPLKDGINFDEGAAYIFHRATGNIWGNIKKITSHDADSNGRFGWSVAIDGDYAVVGAYLEDEGGTDAGAAYIFHQVSAGNWDNGTKIMAPNPMAFDFFGHSVAISGDYVIIGAYDRQVQGPFSGAAFIFHRTGQNAWDDVKEIKALDAAIEDRFGWSVAIDGDYVVVGAYLEDEGAGDAGAAYIFRRISGNNWDNGTKIMASDPGQSDLFGFSVAISGDYAIVGAYAEDEKGTDAGAAYLY